jgi:hypothetical protein
VDRALVRSANERTLDAAVLIAEGDFQMHDVFAMALKPEVPRLNDAGMDRANGNFVHFLPFDPIKIHVPRQRSFFAPIPGVAANAPTAMETDRFEPGVAGRDDTILFGDLPLKEMDFAALWSERRKTPADCATQNQQFPIPIAGNDGKKFQVVSWLRPRKISGYSPSCLDQFQAQLTKTFMGKNGQVSQGN